MSDPFFGVKKLLSASIKVVEPIGDQYARESRESAIALDHPIGMIYSNGRGKHGYVNSGDTVGANVPVTYYPVFLAKPDEQRLLDVIQDLQAQNGILEGRLYRANENLERQPSDYLLMSPAELNLFEKLRATLGLKESGLFDVMAVSDLRIRRLQSELDKERAKNGTA
jgi:hypothetical protein